ncbi:MAG: hypothetical protein M3454_16450 [Actinomycetota bacterium]|nr:hypothetical protein [Actinomycetota bacterium]
MSVEERSRLAMRRRLEEVLGEEHATTLMEYLPPEELATKRDLEGLEQRLTLRISGLEGRMDGLEGRMVGLSERIDLKTESLEHRLHSAIDNLGTSVAKDMIAQTRTFVFSTLGAMASTAALTFAAIRLG